MPTPKLDELAFGKNVKLCREFLGITIAVLAQRSGTTQAAISQIENGKRIPSLTSAVKLANGLGASLSRLLGQAEESQRATPSTSKK